MPWLAVTFDVTPANIDALVDALLETGAVSVEEAATQRLLAVATQQVLPSFFRQKSIALRHS